MANPGKQTTLSTINIRPASSVYATYRRLSYTPWYAIAEFVDNSTQNYYNHRQALQEAYKRGTGPKQLQVQISYDSECNTLTITDNANGMDAEELTRAVVLDKPPLDRSGRCEYGMGLKTAACWFGTTWTIRTSKLGSDKEFIVKVHVPELVENKLEEVSVQEKKADPNNHFTIITIEGLYKPIRGRTAGRIRDQLGSIYRQDLRSGEVEILWNGESVKFEEPSIFMEDMGNVKVPWKKDVAFDVMGPSGKAFHVRGWVGIIMPGSQRDAGFALFRRGRVIVGGPGEGYKPIEIFGQGNTFRSQRLIGEFHMDDWPVTQAKDAFDWSGGLEDTFIDGLKKACQDYMDKAEVYRQKSKHNISKPEMQLIVERTQQVLADQRFGSAIAHEVTLPEPPKTLEKEKSDADKLRKVSSGPVIYHVNVGSEKWTFRLHWQDQLSDAHWMSVSYPENTVTDIFLNMAHPFFSPYLENNSFIVLLQKFVLALALAEKMARQASSNGLVSPGDFRNFMNRVLRHAADIEAEHGF